MTDHPDKKGWVAPSADPSLESVLADFAMYQAWMDAGDVRSFMADQLHENIRFLLDYMDEAASEASMEASRFAVGE